MNCINLATQLHELIVGSCLLASHPVRGDLKDLTRWLELHLEGGCWRHVGDKDFGGAEQTLRSHLVCYLAHLAS